MQPNFVSNSQGYSFSQLEAFWVEAGGPSAIAPVMAAIAAAESSFGTNLRGDYNSKTGQYESFGLWQVNIPAHPQFDPQRLVSDPLYNAWAAVQVWKSQGLGAWTTAWSNDGGNTRVPFAQSSAGQILSQVTQNGTTAFSTPTLGGSGSLSTPGHAVAPDWAPQVKLLVAAIAILLLVFAASGVYHQQKREEPEAA